MNTENAIKSAVGFFIIILLGALLSAIVGGLFGSVVALVSPEFVSGLVSAEAGTSIGRYAFAVGMMWGLFMGAGVSGFACLLAAVIKILRIRLEYQSQRQANKSAGGDTQ